MTVQFTTTQAAAAKGGILAKLRRKPALKDASPEWDPLSLVTSNRDASLRIADIQRETFLKAQEVDQYLGKDGKPAPVARETFARVKHLESQMESSKPPFKTKKFMAWAVFQVAATALAALGFVAQDRQVDQLHQEQVAYSEKKTALVEERYRLDRDYESTLSTWYGIADRQEELLGPENQTLVERMDGYPLMDSYADIYGIPYPDAADTIQRGKDGQTVIKGDYLSYTMNSPYSDAQYSISLTDEEHAELERLVREAEDIWSEASDEFQKFRDADRNAQDFMPPESLESLSGEEAKLAILKFMNFVFLSTLFMCATGLGIDRGTLAAKMASANRKLAKVTEGLPDTNLGNLSQPERRMAQLLQQRIRANAEKIQARILELYETDTTRETTQHLFDIHTETERVITQPVAEKIGSLRRIREVEKVIPATHDLNARKVENLYRWLALEAFRGGVRNFSGEDAPQRPDALAYLQLTYLLTQVAMERGDFFPTVDMDETKIQEQLSNLKNYSKTLDSEINQRLEVIQDLETRRAELAQLLDESASELETLWMRAETGKKSKLPHIKDKAERAGEEADALKHERTSLERQFKALNQALNEIGLPEDMFADVRDLNRTLGHESGDGSVGHERRRLESLREANEVGIDPVEWALKRAERFRIAGAKPQVEIEIEKPQSPAAGETGVPQLPAGPAIYSGAPGALNQLPPVYVEVTR